MVSNEFWMAPSLRDYVESKLRLAFSFLKSKATKISVCLRHLNGQQGTEEMMCQISVAVPGQPEVVVKDVQANMYAAIDMAVNRAAHRARRIMMCKRSRILKAIRIKT
jgi:ribosomal subunit interface protein